MRALITGAGRGIGRAVAARMASICNSLVLMDVDANTLADAARELGRQTRIETVVGSVASSEDCRRAAAAAASLGGLDALSHNAGIQRYGTVETTSEDLWDEVIAVNLTGAFLISKAVMPLLRASRGSVVHMASVQGLASQAGVVAYSTAKHGLVGLVRAMAVDAAPYGVRVNGVAPGSVDTPMLREFGRARRQPGRSLGGDRGHASARPPGDARGDRGSRGVSPISGRLVRHRRDHQGRRRTDGAAWRLAEEGVTGRLTGGVRREWRAVETRLLRASRRRRAS